MNDNQTLVTISEYYQYGFETVVATSTQHGRGLDDLEYELTKRIVPTQTQLPTRIPLALVGKPNTGKSTLMNTLCKKDVSRVSDVPGTTLDYLMHDFGR